MGVILMNIDLLWQITLEEICGQMKLFIILMGINSIIV